MVVVPLSIKEANEFIRLYHRHSDPVNVCKFAIGVVDDNCQLAGVAIAGRPLARELNDGSTLEILRVCSNRGITSVLIDGKGHVVGRLYERCKRIGQLMGYVRFITYTRMHETGNSLKSIAKDAKGVKTRGKSWNSKGRLRTCRPAAEGDKVRWEF